MVQMVAGQSAAAVPHASLSQLLPWHRQAARPAAGPQLLPCLTCTVDSMMWGMGRPGRSFLERPPAPAAVPGTGTTASTTCTGFLNMLNKPCMPAPLDAPVCVVVSAASAAWVVVELSFGSLTKGSIAGLQGLVQTGRQARV